MRARLSISPLSLDQTLGCGQTFRWKRAEDESWAGPLGRQHVTLRKSRGGVSISAFPAASGTAMAVAQYLRASDDVPGIHKALRQDTVLSAGMTRMKGLRIVKMDEWECLVSYTLATYANIPRIRRMIDALSQRYGRRIVDGVYAFPSFRDIRDASPSELERLGFGYRAKYLSDACQMLDNSSIARMKKLDYPALRENLKDLPGIGDKVADCVSLFGFGKLEAFPIDVWIERALKRLYGVSGSYGRLSRFAQDQFGAYAGYAQEYLFFNERTRASSGFCSFSPSP